jgi:hypothetical protein
MKRASSYLLLVCIVVCTFSAGLTETVPESRISVPVAIDLADLAAHANGLLPGTLHSNRYGRTCVEPERVCTKVPEFRGFEVTMKNRCVEVSPRIDCTITETVRREGPIRVSGDGGQIVLHQDIFGSGTVEGRGEIGRHIRQTVRAKAELRISASPRIATDWTPEMPIDISYRWLERPEFRLFNLFPITLGSTLGPPLDKAINDFRDRGLDAELERIDVRSEADRLWRALQAPHQVELPGDETLYLHLRPHSIGLAGPNFDNGVIQARLDVALTAQVSKDPDGPQATPLPNLTPMADAGIALKVPVRLETETLNAAVKKLLPQTLTLGEGATATVIIHDVEAAIDGDLLSIDMMVDAVGGPLSLKNEAVRVATRPVLDSDSHALILSEIDLTSAQDGLVGMAKSMMLNAAELFLAETYTVALVGEVAALEAALIEGLNRDLTPEFRLVGRGRLKASDLRLLPEASALEVTLSSTGNVRVIGFDPVR